MVKLSKMRRYTITIIICNSKTNKVVMDYFFKSINFKQYKN